ncbi:MAG: hypothetical protein OES26_26960 [Gammaproteobacteria bacterium]|nr:hypothetical protein [Gammaproteobacteria bacterium]
MKPRRISSITLRLAALSIIMLAPAAATGQDVLLPCPPPIVDSTADIQNALFETRNGGTVRLGACT